MDKLFKLYLAGQVAGLTYDEASDWHDYVRRRIAPHIECYSPLRGKKFLQREGVLGKHGHENHPMTTPRGIFARDFNDVRTSDCILANLWGAERVSIGTVMAMAWAYALQVPVVLVMEPHAIHRHCMLDQVPAYTVQNLDTAINLVEHLLLPLR